MKKADGRIISINASAKKLGGKCSQLIGLHAISGCDTVSYPFGKGKVSALTVLQKGNVDLTQFGLASADVANVIEDGHKFFFKWYKSTGTEMAMNELRHRLFASKKDTPKIKSLPPTSTALDEHIKRAHLQSLLWKAADLSEPPELDVLMYGWDIVDDTPVPTTGVTTVAPSELMKIIACGCGTETPSSRSNCSCKTAGVSCTTYCKCYAQQECLNPCTPSEDVYEDSDSESDLE